MSARSAASSVGFGRRVVGQLRQFRLDRRECRLALAHLALPCRQPAQARRACAGHFESPFGLVAAVPPPSASGRSCFGQTGPLRLRGALALPQCGDLAHRPTAAGPARPRASPSSLQRPCRSVPTQGTSATSPKRRCRSACRRDTCPASRSMPSICWLSSRTLPRSWSALSASAWAAVRALGAQLRHPFREITTLRDAHAIRPAPAQDCRCASRWRTSRARCLGVLSLSWLRPAAPARRPERRAGPSRRQAVAARPWHRLPPCSRSATSSARRLLGFRGGLRIREHGRLGRLARHPVTALRRLVRVVAREHGGLGIAECAQFAGQPRDFGRRAACSCRISARPFFSSLAVSAARSPCCRTWSRPSRSASRALDLAVAVGRQRSLALGREHRREERLRRAEQFAHGLLVDIDLAVADGAVGQHDRLPVAAGLLEQEGLGLALAIDRETPSCDL